MWCESLTILTLIALPFVAQAEDSRLIGVFSNPDQSDVSMHAAIEATAKEFNFITRPIARNRLRKTNPLLKRLVFARSGESISVTADKGNPCVVTPGNPPVKWIRDDGEVFNTAMEWQGNALLHTFIAPDGTRVSRYSLSKDGAEFTMDVTVTSPQLKAPLNYRLTFRRE